MNLDEYRNLPEVRRQKDPRRQLRGAASRDAGKAFELMIESACRVYAVHGQANIEKTPEPMKPIRDLGGGRFIAAYEKKAQPDFKGTLRGGRAICFEAKHTDTDRMPQSYVTKEQGDALELHSALWALCMVVFSFGYADFFRMIWPDWKYMKEIFGRKYVTAADLEPYRIRVEDGYLQFLKGVHVNGGTI